MKIGVVSFLGLNQDELKRQYLLLDRLIVDGLQEMQNAISGNMSSGASGLGIGISFAYQKASYNEELKKYLYSIRPDIEFLANNGFITKIHEKNIGQGIGLKLLQNELGINPYKLEKGFDPKILFKIQHFSTRLKCHMLRQQTQYDFIPLLGKPLSSNSNENKSVVTSVVLDKFPIIKPNMPWKELSQFKKEFELDHLKLKTYINELPKENFNLVEIEEKIEHDLQALKKRYVYFDQDYETGKLEMFLVLGNRFIKDISKKEYLSATKRLLKFRQTDIQLLKDESDIPRKDLSYLLKAQEKFS